MRVLSIDDRHLQPFQEIASAFKKRFLSLTDTSAPEWLIASSWRMYFNVVSGNKSQMDSQRQKQVKLLEQSMSGGFAEGRRLV